jgi:hypothetical protein
MERKHREEVVRDFQSSANWWWFASHLLASIHYISGLSALLLSIIVASRPPVLMDNHADIVVQNLAWISAFLTGAISFLSAKDSSVRHMQAYRMLQEAIHRYLHAETPDYELLVKARETGAMLIDYAQQSFRSIPDLKIL